MAPKEPKISKQAFAGITRDMMITILETLEIIRKPGSVISESIIMAAHRSILLTN
jgi:hypothetical protein